MSFLVLCFLLGLADLLDLFDLFDERYFLRRPGLPSERLVGSEELSDNCFATVTLVDCFLKLDKFIGGGMLTEILSCVLVCWELL